MNQNYSNNASYHGYYTKYTYFHWNNLICRI